MDLAIRLWSTMPSNPKNIPGIWPARVLENVSVPPDANWQIMTVEQYNAYRATHKATYDTWYAANYPPTP